MSARTVKSGPVCKHCGTPTPSGAEFCCAGCAYVHRLISDQGLSYYYDLRDTVTPPATAALLPPRDYGWLVEAQAAAEKDAAEHKCAPSLTLDIQGISCAGCVWLIERLFQKQEGAGRIEVNAPAGQMRLLWESGKFAAPAFAAELQSFNYLVSIASTARDAQPEARPLARRIGLCTAFAMNTMLFTLPVYFGMDESFPYARLFGTLALVFATLSLLAGGGYFVARAVRSLAVGIPGIDLPVAIGIIGAYGGSFYGWLTANDSFIYFDFVSVFILLMLIGRWAQVAAVERNRRRLLSRRPAAPRVKIWDEDGQTDWCRPEELKTGMRYALGAGQVVPVDSRLVESTVAMSLSWISGEAEPRVYRTGQIIPSGAASLARSEAILIAMQSWPQSLLARLMQPAERPGFRNRVFERIVQGYLIGILGISISACIWWWVMTGDALRAGAVGIATLVVSCPCAIGLALPLADEIAAVALRTRGVFVRVPDLWPRIARVRHVIFDKTGTLTLEAPVLTTPGALDKLMPQARRALIALVRDNRHPVGRALHEAILLRGWREEPLDGEVLEIVGEGVRLGDWSLGKPSSGDAGWDVVFANGAEQLARFQFADLPRVGAREELDALKNRALKLTILSGDSAGKVAKIADALGIGDAEAHGGLSPQDKADRIGDSDTLMLGDGANDSLAFDRALCRGTPAVHNGVLEQKADFYYLGHDLSGIRALFEVNDRRMRAHVLLVVFSITYNLVAIGFAVTGHMSPVLAAIIMPLSSLLTLTIVGVSMKPLFSRKLLERTQK